MVEQRTGSGAVEAVGAAGQEYGKVRGRTQREIVWRRFKRHKLALASALVLALIYLAALLTPVIAPYEYDEPDYSAINQGPSLEHPMGSDRLGRDELTRVLYGGRVSLVVGLGVGLGVTIVGGAVGIASGYLGRRVGAGLTALMDFVLVLPLLPLLLVLGSIFRFSAATVTFVIALLLWPRMARLVRAQVLSVRNQEYVQAARAIGASSWNIMTRHVFPNVAGVMIVEATLVVAQAILIETAISYLGLGIQPPTPSWGNMLEDSRTTMTTQWWLTWFPGLMIVLTALCVNFLGDGLRDALDPKAVE